MSLTSEELQTRLEICSNIYSGYITLNKAAIELKINQCNLGKWIKRNKNKIIVKNPNPNSFKCSLCNWYFLKKSHLATHLTNTHNIRTCSKCNCNLTKENINKQSKERLCIDCLKIKNHERWKNSPNKDRYHSNRNQDHANVRLETLKAYGNKCVCCKETQNEFLSIDHINNDGNLHRNKLKRNIYYWLRDNNYPKDNFQILCHNCNSAKGFYGICPHEKFNNNPNFFTENFSKSISQKEL